jgi:hypothetical protein
MKRSEIRAIQPRGPGNRSEAGSEFTTDFEVAGAHCLGLGPAAATGFLIFSIANLCNGDCLDKMTAKYAPLLAQRNVTSHSG